MATMTMYKGFNPDRLRGGWFWSLKHEGGWNGVWSEPYEVELPTGFAPGETVSGIKAIFEDNDSQAYEVFASSKNENSVPVLIGGTHVKRIRLKVLRKIEDNYQEQVYAEKKPEQNAEMHNTNNTRSRSHSAR